MVGLTRLPRRRLRPEADSCERRQRFGDQVSVFGVTSVKAVHDTGIVFAEVSPVPTAYHSLLPTRSSVRRRRGASCEVLHEPPAAGIVIRRLAVARASLTTFSVRMARPRSVARRRCAGGSARAAQLHEKMTKCIGEMKAAGDLHRSRGRAQQVIVLHDGTGTVRRSQQREVTALAIAENANEV